MWNALGIISAGAGVFLLLWYRTVVMLPVARQPHIIHRRMFRLGVPALGGSLCCCGFALISISSLVLAATTCFAGLVFAFLVIRFDRYTASMRMIYGQYGNIRTENPEMQAGY